MSLVYTNRGFDGASISSRARTALHSQLSQVSLPLQDQYLDQSVVRRAVARHLFEARLIQRLLDRS